ncbi:MAG: hypothetical protein FWD91_00155 [Treponema sp.]|nr:hypothetical protein [Treponema sp.]
MLFVLVILSAGLLGVIIYFAFSRKSSRLLKRAAFAALALIALALVVCGIVLIVGPGEVAVQIPVPGFQEPVEPEPEKRLSTELLIFLLVFLFILGLIIFLVLRGQRKKDSGLLGAGKRGGGKSKPGAD